MSECSTDWDCKCQDSSNNTYLCVRTVSNPGNTIFCIFEDQENFEEMYNIEQVCDWTSHSCSFFFLGGGSCMFFQPHLLSWELQLDRSMCALLHLKFPAFKGVTHRMSFQHNIFSNINYCQYFFNTQL